MKFYKYRLTWKNFIYHFIRKDFVECWRIPTGAKLVFFTAEATVDRFAHRSNQVDVRSFLFQLYGFKLIFVALLI